MLMLSKSLTNNIIQVFQLLGLEYEHSEIYLLLLENGALKPSVISKLTEIPRSSIYDYLRQLSELGLVYEVQERGFLTYTISHPDKLFDQLEYKKNRVNDLAYVMKRDYTKIESLLDDSALLREEYYSIRSKKKLYLLFEQLQLEMPILAEISIQKLTDIENEIIQMLIALLAQQRKPANITINANSQSTRIMDKLSHESTALIKEAHNSTKNAYFKILFDESLVYIHLRKFEVDVISNKKITTIERELFLGAFN